MSVAFTIEIGATTVAVVGAEAVTCAEAVDEKPTHSVIIEIINVIFFIIENDLGFNYWAKEKESFLNTTQEVITARQQE
tara:strand:+ start:5904 stop:6140 length:237 start_codon:yes stop_codon:yes gene_type:complete